MKYTYDVISRPSPEYLAGNLSGRSGVYDVVKMQNGVVVEVVKTFDLLDGGESRRLAYALAGKLLQEYRHEIPHE